MPAPAADDRPTAFRLAVVPGVTVTRWGRAWSERLPEVALQLVPVEVADQAATLAAGHADAGLVRLPVDRDVFHAIPLYTEATVVVVPRDHVVTAADEVTVADLAGERVLRPLDEVPAWSEVEPQRAGTVAVGGSAAVGADRPASVTADRPASVTADRPASTAAAVELVAAGVGVLVVPQSLARLHHRRDLTYRTITDAPTSSVALAWLRDGHTDLVEEMIGIVRGRTANSTRGRSPDAAQPAPTPGTQKKGGARAAGTQKKGGARAAGTQKKGGASAAGTQKKGGASAAGTAAKGGLARRENGSGRTGGPLPRTPQRRRGR